MDVIIKALKHMKVGSKLPNMIRVSSEMLWGGGGIVSVKQGGVASPFLFSLFMDNCLYDLKEYECGLRMDERSVKSLLYTDDQVILALSACELKEVVTTMKILLRIEV
ncbi:hypothetical protein EVAR_54982_1 [Eumeta japonica]|uniref:Reverse transcriptase domain-containing protein n=1 Tax=Eumeta variegata TaxID=151549 RepID=A0A4C1Z6G3_EUMVA|nr:hypothetical protein EVAR_54982_1 [Eumeta japonica]